MQSAKDFPHKVYLLLRNDVEYIGITASLDKRLSQHKEEWHDVQLLDSFMVPTRREAEGVEAQLHQLQRSLGSAKDFFSLEFFELHSLWFCRDHKGYPKHLVQKPRLTF